MNKKLKKIILEKKKIIKEISYLFVILERTKNKEEREMISSQINLLKDSLKKRNKDISGALRKISLVKPLTIQAKNKSNTLEYLIPQEAQVKHKQNSEKIKLPKNFLKLEKETLKRLRKKEK